MQSEDHPPDRFSVSQNGLFDASLFGGISESLRKTGYFLTVPCEVTVHIDADGSVSLCGIVPSYYLKQKAQEAVMSVDGVSSLQNDLIVL